VLPLARVYDLDQVVLTLLLSIEDTQDEFVLRLRLHSGRTSLDDRAVETLQCDARASCGVFYWSRVVSMSLDSLGLELAVEFSRPRCTWTQTSRDPLNLEARSLHLTVPWSSDAAEVSVARTRVQAE